MLAAAGLLWLGTAPEAWGVGRDGRLIAALVHLEIALAVLAVPARPGRALASWLVNFSTWAACWAACSATVLLFEFASAEGPGLATRTLSLSAWLAAGGALALGAALSRQGSHRARVLLLCLFALPALFHYLGLEYSGSSQAHLQSLSPHWLLALDRLGMAWWLAGGGVAAWLGALALCLRPQPKGAP